MKTSKFIVLTLLTLMISACATGPQFKPAKKSDEKGLLYVYREASMGNAGERPLVKIDGEELIVLSSGGYAFKQLNPGIHKISIYKYALVSGIEDKPYFEVDFDIQNDQTLYFKWSTKVNGIYGNVYADTSNKYGFVPAIEGRDQIEHTRLLLK